MLATCTQTKPVTKSETAYSNNIRERVDGGDCDGGCWCSTGCAQQKKRSP